MAHPGLVKYTAIIADSDLDARMRLKQATAAVTNFGKVHQTNSPRETIQRLATGERIDVIFLSYRFETAEISAFIKEAKGMPAGQDAAYILLQKNEDQSASAVASNVMIGADGLLYEPYSVDYLMEITELAARVRKERSDARERGAMQFLVNDIIAQIDLVSTLKAAGYEVGASLKKLKEMCAVFSTLSPTSLEVYYKVAVEQFEKAPVPKALEKKKLYGGASSRVKKRTEAKLQAAVTASSGKTEDVKV